MAASISPASRPPDDEHRVAIAGALAVAEAGTAPVGEPQGVLPVSPRRPRSVALALAIAVVGVFGGAALFLSGYALGNSSFAHPGTPPGDAALFQPFWGTWDTITKQYAGQFDRQKLVEGAIDGMLKALGDPFSTYLSPQAMKDSRQSLAGQFEGIGATMAARAASDGAACATLSATCRLTVVAPIAGSPAEKAGLQPGDVVSGIDGKAVEGLTLAAATASVRGAKGTPVVLTIIRDTRAPFDVRIVRDTISQPQVSMRDLPNGAVYIQLTAFSDSAATDFATDIRAAVNRGATRIVFDLRDNYGGYVTAAWSIASQFIASGPIFFEVGANGDPVPTDAAAGGAATSPSIHVAVLVNGNSASASEVVAGALQDTGRGILVGEQTYGKGTMQAWLDLIYNNDGNVVNSGGFHLTIARWLTPKGRSIHQKGLTPDVVVAPDAADPGPTGDPYIDAALKALGATASQPFGLALAA